MVLPSQLPTSQLALTFGGKGRVQLAVVPVPFCIHPQDAIIRVSLAGVCGSDLHPVHGRESGIGIGCTTGHEFVGTVVQVGDQVTQLQLGDRVASPFTTSCGACFYCQAGVTCRCCHALARGFGWVSDEEMERPVAERSGLQGTHAQFVRVPLADSTCMKVPEGVSDEVALLLGDILSTAFFCAENGGVGPGSRVVVVGCGPVGLLAVMVALHLGAAQVHAIDSIPERLALAESFGATPLNCAACDAAAAVKAATDGRGADVALELVGNSAALRLAFDCLRPAGTLSSIGVNTDAAFPFTPTEAYNKNLTFRTGRCPARHYMQKLLPLVTSGSCPDWTRIITHALPLEDAVRGFRLFDQKQEGCIKVVLRPFG